MAKKEKSTSESIDFENDDGTVDEWVYDMTKNPPQVKKVTYNIRRRKKKKRR